jgi:hypothetical protein
MTDRDVREVDVRGALRAAFNRAPDLQPRMEFADRLREQLRDAAMHEKQPRLLPRPWVALAASVALAAGLAGVVSVNRSLAPIDALARDARGDHWNCALKNRLIRTPVPLEEAAQRFDSAYRLLLTDPPDNISTPDGPAHVVDRHACAYGRRRFGHVVLEYRGSVVSLLVTATDDGAFGTAVQAESTPHLHGRSVNGLPVISIRGPRHVILLVGELGEHDLAQLSRAVSIPLAHRMTSSLLVPDRSAPTRLNPSGTVAQRRCHGLPTM